jgi:hypothetical protein
MSQYKSQSKVQCSHKVMFINLIEHLMERLNNQIDHPLVDWIRHSTLLDVLTLRTADNDSDHYLMMAKVRKRLIVSKQTTHRLRKERFNLKKLNS